MKTASLLLGLALAAFGSGCSSPVQSVGMETDKLALSRTHPKTAAVQTNGGRPTNPLWTSQIADKDLAAAIEASIRKNNLFAGVVKLGDADYVVNATLVNIEQPMVGFNMTVGVEIVWSLTAKGADKPIWEKSIQTRAKKGVGDAFAAVTRIRIATEASTKENIAQALAEIATLSLP